MLTLLIDTSTERGIVSILQDSKILFHKELPYGFTNSKYLLPAIEEALKNTNLSIKQLHLIAAGTGPGSYTGIRVGASVAKSLAYACQLPLVGVCSLEGFLPDRDSHFGVMIDAKISGVYLLQGNKQGSRINYLTNSEVCPIEHAAERLKNINIVVTPNSTRLKLLFPESQWEWQEAAPSPVQMADLAVHKFREGNFSMDGHLDLLYLRKTQAEIERGN